MVIHYHSPYERSRGIHFLGVFIAEDSLNKTLARSEPPAHNYWDHNADELLPGQKDQIKAVFSEIKRHVKEFLARQRQRDVEQTDGCPLLDRELANLFRLPDRGEIATNRNPGSAPGKGQGNGTGDTSRRKGTGKKKTPSCRIVWDTPPHPAQDADGNQIVEGTLRLEVENMTIRQEAEETIAMARWVQIDVSSHIVVEHGQHDDKGEESPPEVYWWQTPLVWK